MPEHIHRNANLAGIIWAVLCLALIPHTLWANQNQASPLNTAALCGNTDYYVHIRKLWEQLKPVYQEWIKNSAETPYNLYNIQGETNNLLKYAAYCQDRYILKELAGLYCRAADALNETDAYVFSYYPLNGPRRSIHHLRKKQRMWLNKDGRESILVSSQFLYLISDTMQIISRVPEAQRSPELQKFLDTYPAILRDHYQRWIFTLPGPFQVRGWGCRVNGKYIQSGMNHEQFIEKKFRKELGDKKSPSYCNAVTDTDLWIIAGAANFVAASYDNTITLSAKDRDRYLKYIQTGAQLLKSRMTYKTLQDWNGKPVTGVNFDLGAWDDHPGHDYAGCKSDTYPKAYLEANIKFRLKNVGWDLSHARRFVHVFGALHENRGILGLSFPDDTFMKQLANQFLYRAFNGDFKKPLFNNFMDGANGWFRVGYDGRSGFGYGPWDMSIAALTGGYGFWAEYNPDTEKLYSALLAMLSSNDPEVREHVREHYEHNHWKNYSRHRAIQFSEPYNTATQRIFFQFWPSLCRMRHVDFSRIFLGKGQGPNQVTH